MTNNSNLNLNSVVCLLTFRLFEKKRNNSMAVLLNFAIDTLSQLILFNLFLLSLDINAIWLALKVKCPYITWYKMPIYCLSNDHYNMQLPYLARNIALTVVTKLSLESARLRKASSVCWRTNSFVFCFTLRQTTRILKLTDNWIFHRKFRKYGLTFGQGGGGGFILNVRLTIVAQKLICESSLSGVDYCSLY